MLALQPFFLWLNCNRLSGSIFLFDAKFYQIIPKTNIDIGNGVGCLSKMGCEMGMIEKPLQSAF